MDAAQAELQPLLHDLQLVAERHLATSDPVHRWLPDIATDREITVDHLLSMRSRLPDYVPTVLGDPPDVTRLRRHYPPEELVGIALMLPGRRPPGQVWRYSNTDYVLLGLIVETITGQPSISTPFEVARFLDALLTGQLLPPHPLAAMRQITPTGGDMAYGRGLFGYRPPVGPALYGHGGTHFGVNCLAFRADNARTLDLYRNSWDHALGGLRLDSTFVRTVFMN